MTPEPPLVGRNAELAALRAMLDRAAGGRLGATLVQARPGLGASTLLASAVALAKERRFQVLLAAAHEFEVHWPFATIAELLDLRASDPDPPRARLQSDLVREIQGGAGRPNEPLFAKRIVDALLGFEGPTLIAIDSIHFADDQSLATLNRALRRGRERRLAVVLACREGETRARVRGLWEALRGEGTAALRLAPLAKDEVGSLATSLFGAPPSASMRERLAGAGGYPLWIVEYAEHATAAGLVVVGDEAEITSTQLPADFVDFVVSRTSALGPAASELLDWLAIAGTASTALLGELTSRDAAEVTGALDAGTVAGLVVETDAAWAFAQELVRDALRAAMPGAVRAERHAAVAGRLETRAAGAERVADQLLFATAAPSPEAAQQLRAAALRMAEASPFQALRLLRHADDVVQRLAAPRTDILLEKTIAALEAGSAEEAVTSSQTLLDTPEARDRHRDARMLHGRSLLLARRYDEAARVFATSDIAGEPLALAYGALANAWACDLPKTTHCLKRFDRAAQVPEDAKVVAKAARATSLHLQGRVVEAADLSAATFNDAAGAGAGLSRMRWMFCELLAFADRQRESQRLLQVEEARATVATPNAAPGLIYVAALNRYLLGEWHGLEETLSGALDADPDGHTTWIETDIKTLYAHVALHRDRVDLAERVAGELAATASATDPFVGLSLIVLQLALPSKRRDAPRLVAVAEERLAAASARGYQNVFWQLTLPLLGSALAVGNRSVAEMCTRIADEVASVNELASASAVAAICAAVQRSDPSLAKRAAEIVAASPRPVLQAAVNEACGAVLEGAGDRQASATHLVSALRIYDELGAARDAARVTSALRPLGVTRQKLSLSEPQEGGWGSLTPAEWRVVRLAARGQTTPAIAERLFLSPRTVQSHLRSSFRKLNVATRAELAAVVSEWLAVHEGSRARD